MSAERYVTPRVIDHLREHLPTVPRRHRPAFTTVQCVLRHLARWARRDGEGRWMASDSVSQICAGCGLSDGTVRDCLEALKGVGLVTVMRRGGGHGLTARGSTRWIHLDDPTARMNKTEDKTVSRDSPAELRSKSRGDGVQIPRSWATNSAGPSRAVEWAPAAPHESRMWTDDSDIEAAPPPVAETLAAIRAWRAGGDAPVLRPVVVVDPPAPPRPARPRYGGPLDR